MALAWMGVESGRVYIIKQSRPVGWPWDADVCMTCLRLHAVALTGEFNGRAMRVAGASVGPLEGGKGSRHHAIFPFDYIVIRSCLLPQCTLSLPLQGNNRRQLDISCSAACPPSIVTGDAQHPQHSSYYKFPTPLHSSSSSPSLVFVTVACLFPILVSNAEPSREVSAEPKTTTRM